MDKIPLTGIHPIVHELLKSLDIPIEGYLVKKVVITITPNDVVSAEVTYNTGVHDIGKLNTFVKNRKLRFVFDDPMGEHNNKKDE